jgi:hydroxymethylbilane synthase
VDLPARIAKTAQRHGVPPETIVVLESMGDHPLLLEAMTRSVNDVLDQRTWLVAGARGSRLSRAQVCLVEASLAAHGVSLRLQTIDTVGDRDRATPIGQLGVEDPFSGEIDDALRDGRIDVAVHSAKDLSLDDQSDLIDAAYLPRGSVHDVLVTRDGGDLSALASGARIGTSCERRASQLKRMRPDVVPVPIRGDVPARVAAVDRGDVDAVVLAAAGLERLALHGRIAERFSTTTFVPAPAQGAIVIRCRADSLIVPLVRRIDDRPTRLAVEAELAFARGVADDPRSAAAHAVVRGDRVVLHSRLIDAVTLDVHDVKTYGRDPRAVGAAAARAVR